MFGWLKKQRRGQRPQHPIPHVGAIVIDVEADGCMAHIHKIQRVAKVVAVRDQREIYGPKSCALTVAVCESIPTWSGTPVETFNVPLGAGSWFFERAPNTYVYIH
jgi:hypothetical protein